MFSIGLLIRPQLATKLYFKIIFNLFPKYIRLDCTVNCERVSQTIKAIRGLTVKMVLEQVFIEKCIGNRVKQKYWWLVRIVMKIDLVMSTIFAVFAIYAHFR